VAHRLPCLLTVKSLVLVKKEEGEKSETYIYIAAGDGNGFKKFPSSGFK
jgi:hypothetical protein